MSLRIVVQQQDFAVAREYERLRQDARCGAVVTFTGLVRELAEAELLGMTLEHYPGMTEKALTQIVDQAKQRWDIFDALVIHRIGELSPLDQIVLVAVSSAHREEAFSACQFIMDYLKTEAPFWKKEETPSGARWVEAKASDDSARERWNKS